MENKKFDLVTITTQDNPDGYLGYLCSERVTFDDIQKSSELPEGIKVNPHIYSIRSSACSSRKVTIEPKVKNNFGGSFVTSEDLFDSLKNDEYKQLVIIKIIKEDKKI